MRAEEILKKMREDRGYTLPEWEYAAKLDPDFFEVFSELYPVTFKDGKYLPAKVRELIHIAIISYRGLNVQSIAAHMRRAMSLGATKLEILEALETAMNSSGTPTLYHGIGALMALEEEEEKAESDQ
jgi:alkylhydroperoxidase/carboxymuconolactone decarboxylase family protein YurZ